MGRHRRRVPELERQARHLLPPHRGHPRRMGHRGQRAGHGVRQHGRRLRPPAWPSPATRPPARTSSTASGSPTPRARTWWPASAPRTPSTRPARPSTPRTCRPWRRQCAEIYKELDAIQQAPGEALPGHAGHRVHHRGGQAVDAAVPRGQAQRARGRAHGGRHGAGEADQPRGGGRARHPVPARRAAAPHHRPGQGKGGQDPGQGPSGRSRRRRRPGRAHRRGRRGVGQGGRERSSWCARRPTRRTSTACARPRPS